MKTKLTAGEITTAGSLPHDEVITVSQDYTQRRLEEFEKILRDGLSEDWYDRTPLEKQRAIDALSSTSINQAIAEERERVRGEIDEVLDIVKNNLYPFQDDKERLEIVIAHILSSLDPLTEKEKNINKRNIGMLRQWLNEDRITDPNKMVTDKQLEFWLKDVIKMTSKEWSQTNS